MSENEVKLGRPRKFQSVEELQEQIEDYFNTTPKDEWTITGLALALDTSRKVLLDYENMEDNDLYSDIDENERKMFSNTIKKAKAIVENSYEIDLKKRGKTGTIFALKNFGWSDKKKVDLTSKGKQIEGINYLNPDGDNAEAD